MMLFRQENLYENLRRLAKSYYWQTVYNQSKEISCIDLFENKKDFSDIQITFLNYLNFYCSLSLDIAMGEVDEIIYKDFIYEDAYMYYRRKKSMIDNSEEYVQKREPRRTKKNNDKDILKEDKWIFKTPRN